MDAEQAGAVLGTVGTNATVRWSERLIQRNVDAEERALADAEMMKLGIDSTQQNIIVHTRAHSLYLARCCSTFLGRGEATVTAGSRRNRVNYNME